MQTENLFQIFSQVFINSQQSFSKTDVELRTKCRTLAEKLNKFVQDLEDDPFEANLMILQTLDDDVSSILKNLVELEEKRKDIKKSVEALKNSTQSKTSFRR